MRRGIRGHLLRRAGGDDLATAMAAFGAEVDHPVRGLDHVQVVLDHDHGVAVVAQAMQHGEQVLGRLVDAGNTVVVIEHNLDVIKTADWVIDIGPEGGSGGGRVIAAGTPEAVAGQPASYTGRFLKQFLSDD